MPLKTPCAYCERMGTISHKDKDKDTLEIRYEKIVCKDTKACDKYWDRANPAEPDE